MNNRDEVVLIFNPMRDDAMSVREENRALNAAMSNGGSCGRPAIARRPSRVAIDPDDGDEGNGEFTRGLVQWTSHDGRKFVPASRTVEKLLPGAYEVSSSQSVGIYFEKIDVKTEGLVRFPDTNSEKVIDEIVKFWDREDRFKEFSLNHKRGICLWGPPGGGKSCTIQFIMKDVIARDGIVLKFTHPAIFSSGMRILREIQPDTPIVVLMEDLDSIIENYCESDVLNLLDGVDRVQKIVFLATTNYPEILGPRIINRPSRFDKRIFIGYPNADSRRAYFRHLISGGSGLEGDELEGYVDHRAQELGVDLDEWVDQTEDFSVAHLKELFVAVVIQGDPLDEALDTLRSMRNKIVGDHDYDARPTIGF